MGQVVAILGRWLPYGAGGCHIRKVAACIAMIPHSCSSNGSSSPSISRDRISDSVGRAAAPRVVRAWVMRARSCHALPRVTTERSVSNSATDTPVVSASAAEKSRNEPRIRGVVSAGGDVPRCAEMCRDLPRSAEMCRDEPRSAEMCRDVTEMWPRCAEMWRL